MSDRPQFSSADIAAMKEILEQAPPLPVGPSLAEFERLSQFHAQMVERLRASTVRHNLQRYGEQLDVIVCDALDDAMNEIARLKALLPPVRNL